jgi:hypothetical protein
VEPSDQEMYDQLLGYLAAEGVIEEDSNAGIVTLTEFNHRPLDPPSRLHLTPASFGQHLREAAPDSAGLYPEIPPIDAAWRLFTVHLEEGIGTARPGETELVLARGGVYPRRPDGTRTPFTPDIERRIVLDEYHEKLIQHYADRGELEIDARHEVLTLHNLDGRPFSPPLRVRVASAELRDQMRLADDPEAAWQQVVDQIDAHAATADPHASELELTPDGIVARPR